VPTGDKGAIVADIADNRMINSRQRFCAVQEESFRLSLHIHYMITTRISQDQYHIAWHMWYNPVIDTQEAKYDS